MDLSKRQRKALKKLCQHIPGYPDRLGSRVQEKAHIERHAEAGMVAIVSGGVDCDGSRWDGDVDLVPATVMSVERWWRHFFDTAEGPQWFHLERPSVAREIKRTSRDLALEAFENGHPHSIIY